MITLKAKFIGKTSLGFNNGKEYELMIDYKSTEVDIESKIGIFPNEETLRCMYSNTSKFLENWEVLSINKMDTKSKHFDYITSAVGVAGRTGKSGPIMSGSQSTVGSIGVTASSGFVGKTGVTGSSGFVGITGQTGKSGAIGIINKDFQRIENEIRSDMRNNKLEKILTPLTNGKNSLV